MAKRKIAAKELEKVNPLNKKIDKNDTTDTGVESLRLGYRTAKKTYTTSKSAVHGVKLLYKAPVKTVRAAIWTVRAASTVLVHTAAILLNPLFWILVVILLLILVIAVPCVMILGGGAAGGTTTNKAVGTAAGSKQEISTIFPQAEEFFDNACTTKQNEFNSFVDSMYYSTDDLQHSDLVYMVCSNDDTVFQTSLATDNRKQQLKDKFSKSISKTEAIALVYVNLEKQKNTENNTEGQIYEIEFTQQAFDDLLGMMVSWSDTVYGGQECPQKNCSVHQEEIPNPAYDDLFYKVDMSAGAFNDWGNIIPYLENLHSIHDGHAQSQYWDNNIQWRIDNWNIVYGDFVPVYPYTSNDGNDFLSYLGGLYAGYADELDNTPQTITKTTVTCDHLHNLHSVGLNILSKDDVMAAWNFSDVDKEWFEITYKGFQVNPDINADP